ncbi:MAG: hypothetical protein JO112_14300 [Planctomycetes bacterium]|nr:hypothetical protein [Planctomycetota bacterium]
MVTGLRRLTTRLPHPLLLAVCYPMAVAAWCLFVLPYRLLSRSRHCPAWMHQLPLKQYADYPFGVLLNDQFDRFSAPIERRYSRDQVRHWLEDAGLQEVTVAPFSGWLGYGRKPEKRAFLEA